MARIDITTSTELKHRFQELSASLGLTQGEHGRIVLEQYMQSNVKGLIPDYKTKCTRKSESKKRAVAWLTESELAGLERLAELYGRSNAGVLISTLRFILTREPQLSESEMEALRMSNYLMTSIARDLNLIARELKNAGANSANLEGLEGMVSTVKAHTKTVDDLLRSNSERWSPEVIA